MSRWLLGIAVLGTVSSTVYLALVLSAAVRFKKRRPVLQATESFKPISCLKPVHGNEPRLEENLETFFRQRYPEYELLFCARFASDAAFQAVQQVQSAYPNVKVRCLQSGEPQYTNAKTYSLQYLVQAAEHELLVITDSDVAIQPDLLQQLAPYFDDPNVGLVCCLYRGVATGSIWSRLEALGMTVEMSSGVLVADMLEGMRFALGPCMAMTKQAVAAIGGMESIADYLAEDFVLGQRIYAAGFKTILAHPIVDHIVTNRRFKPSLQHQVRWARSTRFSRQSGYIWEGTIFAMPFGLLGYFASGGWLGVGLLTWAYLSRVLQATVIGGWVLRDRECMKWCLLYPVRDLMGFFFWAWAFVSKDVLFRGEQYSLYGDGKVRRKQYA